jgi:hypothetical protein
MIQWLTDKIIKTGDRLKLKQERNLQAKFKNLRNKLLKQWSLWSLERNILKLSLNNIVSSWTWAKAKESKNLNKNLIYGLNQLKLSLIHRLNLKMKDHKQDQKLNYNFGDKEYKLLPIGLKSLKAKILIW